MIDTRRGVSSCPQIKVTDDEKRCFRNTAEHCARHTNLSRPRHA